MRLRAWFLIGFGGSSLRQLIPALIIAVCLHLAASMAHALTLVHFWSQRYGSTGTDAGPSVAADGSGNLDAFESSSFYMGTGQTFTPLVHYFRGLAAEAREDYGSAEEEYRASLNVD